LGEAEQVRNAVANADSAYIQKASGVGKKTAERVVVDLSDKVGLATKYDVSMSNQAEANPNDEALEALMALGYNLADASKALEGVPTDIATAARVTMALKGSN
jgi:Holliday junction DNA helicase RuvA